jgi:enediyne biosynthesis protein E5
MPERRSTWSGSARLGGLRRFATAITILNVLGHTVLGFEQAWITPFVAVAAAYATEWLLDVVAARAEGRRPRVHEEGVDFFLSAHISGLAIGMLLYANGRLAPVIFAVIVAIASKVLLRCRVNGHARHVLNPSNFGIAVTLLAFPTVGIAPPYHFTENLGAIGDWLLPSLIVVSGSFLNWRFTRRVPLLTAWLVGFVAQAVIRSAWSDAPLGVACLPALAPMTGLAFLLYTFYMVTDPATTPSNPASQIAFGLGVAATYAILVSLHIVFGLFFALSIVAAARAIGLLALSLRAPARDAVRPATVVLGEG